MTIIRDPIMAAAFKAIEDARIKLREAERWLAEAQAHIQNQGGENGKSVSVDRGSDTEAN